MSLETEHDDWLWGDFAGPTVDPGRYHSLVGSYRKEKNMRQEERQETVEGIVTVS